MHLDHQPRYPVPPPNPPRTMRIPSPAALALRAIMVRDCRNHGLKLADILGIYPA